MLVDYPSLPPTEGMTFTRVLRAFASDPFFRVHHPLYTLDNAISKLVDRGLAVATNTQQLRHLFEEVHGTYVQRGMALRSVERKLLAKILQRMEEKRAGPKPRTA